MITAFLFGTKKVWDRNGRLPGDPVRPSRRSVHCNGGHIFCKQKNWNVRFLQGKV